MKPQQTSYSEADLLSAGATLCYIYTLHAANDPKCRPRYVGFSRRPKRRQIEHNSGFGYGRNGEWIRELLDEGVKVVLTVIHTFRSDNISERGVVEATWIETYRRRFPDLLNDAGGGSGVAEPSEVCRKRNSESKKKHYRDRPEKAKQHSEKMKAHYRNPEARRKTREAGKLAWEAPSRRKEMSKRSRSYWSNPAARAKKSEEMKSRYSDPKERQKHSERLKAGFAKPGVREKMSNSLKRRYEDPELRKKTGESTKRFWSDPENRKKIIEAQKRGRLEKLLNEF